MFKNTSISIDSIPHIAEQGFTAIDLKYRKVSLIYTTIFALIILGVWLAFYIFNNEISAFISLMFLYNKTILIGATLLALYMTFIVFIHMYKGKPYEVTILIVMTTIFAAYIRMAKTFHQSKE